MFNNAVNELNYILAKSESNCKIPLTQHLEDVAKIAVIIAKNMGMDEDIAWKGAVLHDIGKVSPLFQNTLKQDYIYQPGFVFRHEIASLFFLSLVENEQERLAITNMIVAHHKSIFNDVRGKGLLDLNDNMDSFSIHVEGFDLAKRCTKNIRVFWILCSPHLN